MRLADPLDGFRTLLTLFVGVFHAVSEMTWTLTKAETAAVIAHPLGRAVALGYGCVDGFFMLTGLFTTEALLRRWSNASKPGVTFKGDVLPVLEGRWVRLWVPLLAVVAWYVAVFSDGKYPMSSVRNEEALGAMRSFAVLTSADRSPTLPGMRGSSMEMLPLLLLGGGNVAPFGGALSHMWSLAVQLQWYIFWPLVPFFAWKLLGGAAKGSAASPSAVASGALAFAAWMLIVASSAIRALVFVKEAGFAGTPGGAANPVYSGFHFLWYAAFVTRAAPLAVGALVAIGRHKPQHTILHRLATASFHPVWDALLVAVVVGLNLSVSSDADLTGVEAHTLFGDAAVSARAAAYVLARPGGLLSSCMYARLVASIAALADVPASGSNAEGKAPAGRVRSPLLLRALQGLARGAPYAFTFYLINSSVYDMFYGFQRRLHPCAGWAALQPASGAAGVAEEQSPNAALRLAGSVPDAISAATQALWRAASLAVGGVEATGICDAQSGTLTAAGWAQIGLYGGVCIAVTALLAVVLHHWVEKPLVAIVLQCVGQEQRPGPRRCARSGAAVCCLRTHIALAAVVGTLGAGAMYALALLNVSGDTARRFAQETGAEVL